ncbi:hypothetical protein HNY73_022537 [Argiope bruennichi]|uniref:Uncharacterized protein n=1 Tax=Argiope bruennichi TaxID=94029 RepID=A0A8T0E4T9_ARGBR|nr:hypothetical protein HNY73_022537 [Argiope bruennichi]
MSTPLKLNVTFWDMQDKPNNGYAKNPGPVQKKATIFSSLLSKYFNPLPVKIGIGLSVLFLIWLFDSADTIGAALPFLAVAGVHFWHSVFYRNQLTDKMSHFLLCANVLAEVVGGSVSSGFGIWSIIHFAIIFLTCAVVGQESTMALYAGSRLFLWACLPWFPDNVRTVLCYASILAGTIAAKYFETFMITQILSELKLSTPRRRRTSNNTIYNAYKLRRTSLPALGGSNKGVHHSFAYQEIKSTLLNSQFSYFRWVSATNHLPGKKTIPLSDKMVFYLLNVKLGK